MSLYLPLLASNWLMICNIKSYVSWLFISLWDSLCTKQKRKYQSMAWGQKVIFDIKRVLTSDGFELEIGEPSRAEPSWIFPSRAELVGFRNRAEPSWAKLNIFRNELNTSWIFLGNHFFVSNKFNQKVLYWHKFQVYWCFWSIVLSDFLLYQINKGIKSNFDNVLLFLTIFHHASWIF